MDNALPDVHTTGARPPWAPPEVDLARPSAARISDYMLGGSHHFAADRQMAEQMLSVDPRIGPTAHANRAFLRRAVQFLAAAGIRQFLDLGSGIPTVGNVHEVARQAAPDSRVVYVDFDPVAVAHSRAIVGQDENVLVLQADICQPGSILADPQVRELLDFTQPIAILLVAVLHYIPDEANPAAMIATLRDAVPPGSYLVISQAAIPEEVTAEGEAVLARVRQAMPVALRDPSEIATFFTGFDLVDPGLVHVARWRPEPDSTEDPAGLALVYVGVGVKR